MVDEDFVNRELGARCRKAREATGLSAAAVGKRLTPPRARATVSEMELGGLTCSVPRLLELALIYGVPMEYFLKGLAPGVEIHSANSTT